MINLAFVADKRKHGRYRDVLDAADRIRRRAADISVSVFDRKNQFSRWVRASLLATRPTLVIDMVVKAKSPFSMLRGHYLKHWPATSKIDELRILDKAGLPVPRWIIVEPDTVLDPGEWGPYVVLKPSRGYRGAYVRIRKTGRVRYKPPEQYPEDHLGRKGPMYAQRFVYTGRWPVAYRVLTFLGRPLLAIRYDGRQDNLPPLDSSSGFGKASGVSIVANAMGCMISCIDDADILELAMRTHAAFPDVPSLGVDIIRDMSTGQLYVMEANPIGDSWALSGDRGVQMQRQFGLDFYTQFGALDIMADAAIDAARRLAR